MTLTGELNQEELVTLAGINETPAGRICLKVMAQAEARWGRKRDVDPLLNTERVHDDMRYVLGAVDGSRTLNAAMKEAQIKLGIRAEGVES
jgi:hypothetical protein